MLTERLFSGTLAKRPTYQLNVLQFMIRDSCKFHLKIMAVFNICCQHPKHLQFYFLIPCKHHVSLPVPITQIINYYFFHFFAAYGEYFIF